MVLEQKQVAVGLGEFKISCDPQEVLVAYGLLGACLGVGIYDPHTRLAGLLHAVLPQCKPGLDMNSPKYVESGLPQLLHAMCCAGAVSERLIIHLVGGANLFMAPDLRKIFNVGERNLMAAHTILASRQLQYQTKAVVGRVAHTLRVYVADGRMTVRVIGAAEEVL